MALTAKILNSEASLNFWIVLSSIDFIPGAEVDVKLRLFNTDTQERYVPPATTVATIELQNADGTSLVKTMSLDADDRSIMSCTISEAESELLVGGNVLISLDVLGDASKIVKGIIHNGIRALSAGC